MPRRPAGGRPGIDPVVYFKMLMIGFFEGLGSEREIASRCADSLSLRGFLGYALDEATPDHSSMSVIRQRLGGDCFARVFALVLEALQRHGLLKGRHLGIDSSVIEANASLRSLCERNTEEGYWDYVRRLAREAGLETSDGAALRNFDRQTLARAQRSAGSKYGKGLLRKRGQHIERSFAHVLDAGGMRRTTLRGLENLNKRHQIAAACYNLSQLLRRLYGVGTPKQWVASLRLLLSPLLCLLTARSSSFAVQATDLLAMFFRQCLLHGGNSENPGSSTAC